MTIELGKIKKINRGSYTYFGYSMTIENMEKSFMSSKITEYDYKYPEIEETTLKTFKRFIAEEIVKYIE